MSVDFSTALDDKEPIQTITSISTNFVEITFPDTTKRISVSHPTKDLYLSFSYADGAAGTSTKSAMCRADRYFSMTVQNGLNKCQVASVAGTASNVIFIMEVE